MSKKQEKPIYCQKDMLALLGTADTLGAAPYEDTNFEIWGVAQTTTYPVFKRADLLFELHAPEYWRDKNVLARLRKWEGPTVMQRHYSEIPRSIAFPLETILQYRRYHTTSITYMLALAYHSFLKTGKPKHVAMFGVHMEAREEYTEQRPCCEYWLGRMEGAGMDIFNAAGAILASQGLYAYENYDVMCHKLRDRIDGLRNGAALRENEEKTAQLKKHEQLGAAQEAEFWLREFQTGRARSCT